MSIPRSLLLSAVCPVAMFGVEPIHIDFTTPASAPMDGYLADRGGAFPSYDRAGLTYGWTAGGMPTIERVSPLSPDRRYDTAVVFQSVNGQPAFWFIRVTNGDYRVHVAAGDPGDPLPNRMYGIAVQDHLVIDGTSSPEHPWLEGEARVTVSDGILRVQQRWNVSENRICFLDITPLPVDFSASIPASSPVSPVCVEGSGPAGGPAIRATSGGQTVPVVGLSDTTYYADAPLSTAPTPISLTQDGGATISGTVRWTPTALTDQVVAVRAGDSLLLQAAPGATVRITASCGTEPAVTLPATGLLPYAFTKPGFYTLAAEGAVGTLRVTAAQVGFAERIACGFGYQRRLSVAVQPAGAEDQVKVVANDSYLVAVHRVASDAGGAGRQDLTLLPEMPGHPRLVARLAGSKAILGQRPVDAFTLRTSAEQYIPVVATYPDGSMLTSSTLTMTPLIPHLDVRLHIFVGGVTFADSTTSMTVSTDAFAADGTFPYQMIRAPDGFAKLCHTFVAYQDGTQVSP